MADRPCAVTGYRVERPRAGRHPGGERGADIGHRRHHHAPRRSAVQHRIDGDDHRHGSCGCGHGVCADRRIPDVRCGSRRVAFADAVRFGVGIAFGVSIGVTFIYPIGFAVLVGLVRNG